MAKPNYSFEKRQRELAKKKKKEEKQKEKDSRKTTPGVGGGDNETLEPVQGNATPGGGGF